MLKPIKTSQRMVRVNTRLFEADLKEVKRQAAAKGLPWQLHFRLFVRESLGKSTKVQ